MRLARKLSQELSKKFGAQNRLCYHNAFRAIYHFGREARYVEGYVIRTDIGMVFEHGWIEHNGRIIDTTPTFCEDGAPIRYFTGIRYTLHDLSVVLHDQGKKCLPLVGMGGLRDARYRRACLRAHRAVYGKETTDRMFTQLRKAVRRGAKG